MTKYKLKYYVYINDLKLNLVCIATGLIEYLYNDDENYFTKIILGMKVILTIKLYLKIATWFPSRCLVKARIPLRNNK